jgi:hypothetical protein
VSGINKVSGVRKQKTENRIQIWSMGHFEFGSGNAECGIRKIKPQ